VRNEFFFKTAFCSEYEYLLENSQRDLEVWNDLDRKVKSSECAGPAVSKELENLQARFVRSYDLLQDHMHTCELCQFVVAFASRNLGSYQGGSVAATVN